LEKGSSMSISESLLEAFRLMWDMYDDAFKGIPVEHWRTGEIDYLIPARQVYHAVQAADFYCSPGPDDFKWGDRFGRCFDSPPEGLPTLEQARDYQDEVRDRVTEWIHGLGDSGLLSKEESFPWTGSVVLGRALYLLGHCRHHFGELNAELRRRGLPRIQWKTY
jgi:hypothetical protein